MNLTRTALAAGALMAALMAATSGTALAQTSPTAPLNPNATNPNQGGGSAASKLMLRGEAYGVSIAEIRAQRRNEMLVVQTELLNGEKSDRQVYWRYRWLDADGMQVGDDDAWKPQRLMGQQSVYLKGVAPKSTVVDFRIEMNVEK
jgi:uncharacterized protein YcfL